MLQRRETQARTPLEQAFLDRFAQPQALEKAKEASQTRCVQCGARNRVAHSLGAVSATCGRCGSRLPRPEVRAGRALLCDVSASMSESAGTVQRIEVLRSVLDRLNDVLSEPSTTLMAFSSYPTVCRNPADLPGPSGSTDLHAALRHDGVQRVMRVIVLSDGYPDDPTAALRTARTNGIPVDAVYCGSPSDGRGPAFLRQIAEVTGGRFTEASYDAPDAVQRLTAVTRGLLLGSSRK